MKEYKLPAKWCIKGTYQEVVEYSNKFGESKPYEIANVDNPSYHHYPCIEKGITSSSMVNDNYIEISLEKFKQYVLKEFVVQINDKPEDLSYLKNLLIKLNLHEERL